MTVPENVDHGPETSPNIQPLASQIRFAIGTGIRKIHGTVRTTSLTFEYRCYVTGIHSY